MSDVLEFDFEQSVGCWITLTSHALRRALNEELAEAHWLSPAELPGLMATEGLTQIVAAAERIAEAR